MVCFTRGNIVVQASSTAGVQQGRPAGTSICVVVDGTGCSFYHVPGSSTSAILVGSGESSRYGKVVFFFFFLFYPFVLGGGMVCLREEGRPYKELQLICKHLGTISKCEGY